MDQAEGFGSGPVGVQRVRKLARGAGKKRRTRRFKPLRLSPVAPVGLRAKDGFHVPTLAGKAQGLRPAARLQMQAGGDFTQRTEPLQQIIAGLKLPPLDPFETNDEATIQFGDRALRASYRAHGAQAWQVLQRGQPCQFGRDLGPGVIARAMQAQNQ